MASKSILLLHDISRISLRRFFEVCSFSWELAAPLLLEYIFNEIHIKQKNDQQCPAFFVN